MLWMVGATLRLSWIGGVSTLGKRPAGRQTSSQCPLVVDRVKAPPHRCAGRRLRQDMSWLESPIYNGVLQIGKEPSGYANQYCPSYCSEPIQHNRLEIDNVLLLLNGSCAPYSRFQMQLSALKARAPLPLACLLIHAWKVQCICAFHHKPPQTLSGRRWGCPSSE